MRNLSTRRNWLLLAGAGLPMPAPPPAARPIQEVDLTRVEGAPGRARGTIVHLGGVVRTVYGVPIPGAIVELQQACASGRSDHPDDEHPAPLDPCFRYWGRVATGPRGGYGFVTVKPGASPGEQGRLRAPHIRVHVVAPGFRALATQLFFAGEPLNATDRVLTRVPRERRALLMAALEPVPGRPGHLAGSFDIVLGAPAKGATPDAR